MEALSRRGTKIALATAPVVAAAVVLGVLFGRRAGNKPTVVDAPPEDELPRSFITNSPSITPSVAVTEPRILQCPIDGKEFVLKYSNRGQRQRRLETQPHQQQQRSLTEFATWYVKDTCTGNKVLSCAPCTRISSQESASLSPVTVDSSPYSSPPSTISSSSLPPTPGSSISSSSPTEGSAEIQKVNESPYYTSAPVATPLIYDTSSYHSKTNDNNDRHLQNGVVPNAPSILIEASRECIPGDLSYVFVVEPAQNFEECCSFDAAEYVVTYDDEVIAFVGANGSSSGSNSIEQQILFGKTGIECASNSPSEIVSMKPSAKPTFEPSIKPSVTTTAKPSVVSSNAPSISSSTSPSASPSASPSYPPSQSPTSSPIAPLPTISPTLPPTSKSPTASPTKGEKVETPQIKPTPIPSLRPTCKFDQNFNLCIAVDMSGSICSNDSGCIGCPSDTCRNEFVTEGTCCNNFAFVKGFASLMIQSLSKFQSDQTFSIVQFATEGQLISLMQSDSEALSTIDDLYYTGGITNHAEAIRECRRSLAASHGFQNSNSAAATPTETHQNIMMLITDGKPTTPEDDPFGAAKAEARKAKEENGVFIIPVFISPKYDGEALSFMRGLSSNDKVFDVVDFESLKTLKERLVKEISCSL